MNKMMQWLKPKRKLRRPVPSQREGPKSYKPYFIYECGANSIIMVSLPPPSCLHGSPAITWLQWIFRFHQLHMDDSFTHTSLKEKKAVNYKKINDTQAVFTT